MRAASFTDYKLEDEFARKGFVIIPGFLSKDETDYLLNLFNVYYNKTEAGFWNSMSNLAHGKGLEISEQIKAITNQHFEKLLQSWQFPIAQFIVKNPNDISESMVHRDFSVHDEEEIQYRQVWVPLVDLTKENGALYVVPGSHRLFTDSRPMFADWPYEHLIPRLEKEFYPVYAKAGDLILYAEKTLHGSSKNISGLPRPAFTGGIIPLDAEIIYARYIKERSIVETYSVDREFYYNKEFENPVIDKKYPLKKSENYVSKIITEADIDNFYTTYQKELLPEPVS